jgi:hypothetical protein
MANLRNSSKVKKLAGQLRDECAQRGIVLLAAEAENILAGKIEEIAQTLGVSQRTALDSYTSPDMLRLLADALQRAGHTYRDAVAEVAPVLLTVTDAGRVTAALGMAAKLAVDALDAAPDPAARSDALGVATDCADAVVGVGVAIQDLAEDSTVQIAAPAVVHTRKVLQRTLDALAEGNWPCPCPTPHAPPTRCALQQHLIEDLNLVGGWVSGGPQEPPAHQR